MKIYFNHREWWFACQSGGSPIKLSGFEILFRNLRTMSVFHYRDNDRCHGWLPKFSEYTKTSKLHLFVLINHFLRIFPVYTLNNIKYTILRFQNNIIQAIKVLCARILRSHHLVYFISLLFIVIYFWIRFSGQDLDELVGIWFNKILNFPPSIEQVSKFLWVIFLIHSWQRFSFGNSLWEWTRIFMYYF